MESEKLLQLQQQSQHFSTAELIRWASSKWVLLLASSIGAEDQVLWDLLWQNYRQNYPNPSAQGAKSCAPVAEPRLFSLDTGRLPQETYDCIEQTEARYGIRIELTFPQPEDLQFLLRQGGPNLFYQGQTQRKLCCKFRKVEPLRLRLRQHFECYGDRAAWLTGQRRSQSVTRSQLPRIEWDEQFGLVKLNPLADWQAAEVWHYIRQHKLPYNALHDQGYPSIGCAPCTRAVAPGEDERSGRWWWEESQQKECGIHIAEDGTVQRLSQK